MLASYLITFREVFEASLITAIIITYLLKTGRKNLIKYVWIGVFLSIFSSLVLGFLIWFFYGGLSKKTQILFETIASFLAVFVLTWVVYWMALKGRYLKKEIERKIEEASTKKTVFALVLAVFIIVFREGLETVLFLTPFFLKDVFSTVFGFFLGVFCGLALSYLFFYFGVKIDIKKFFYFTSIFLIFIAAGLVGYGVHELFEFLKKINFNIGFLGDYAYKLNIDSNNPFHHKGIIGSVFAVMFGYTVYAELGRLIFHLLYLVINIPIVSLIYRKKS